MRDRRRSLADEPLAAAGAAVTQRLRSLPALRNAGLVAGYLAARGEVPLDDLFAAGLACDFTVPRVIGDDLEFVSSNPRGSLVTGAFGISEPASGDTAPLGDHDVVLVPLVAFDSRCQRLGQGRGFYDRALAALGPAKHRPRPVAIGVAHWFQRVDNVPSHPWDVALDAVVTDRELTLNPVGLLSEM